MRSLGLIRKVSKDLQKYNPWWDQGFYGKLDIHVFPVSSDTFQNQAFSFNFHSLETINSLEVVKDIQHVILLVYMEAGPDLLIQLLLIHEDLRALCLLIGPDTCFMVFFKCICKNSL